MWDMVQFIMANRYEKVRGIYTAKMEGQKAAVLHLSSSDRIVVTKNANIFGPLLPLVPL